MTPTNDTYAIGPGVRTIRLGLSAPAVAGGEPLPPTAGRFSAVTLDGAFTNGPSAAAGQTVVIELHGSGTPYSFPGARYTATLADGLEYAAWGNAEFKWAIANGGTANGNAVTIVRPWDNQGTFPSGYRRESYWMGWTDGPDVGQMRLYTMRRLLKMIEHIKANQPNLSATKWALTGGSMGGWGTMTFGIRRPYLFPAIWPDRPKWRWASPQGTLRIPSWTNEVTPGYSGGASPSIVAADGGGSMASLMDLTTYVANPANRVPWIGWCVGRNDTYMDFQDHVDAVAALRAAGRGFAFYWNNGNHSDGNRMVWEITPTYPFGLFELGKGYPVFSEHSLDNDPAVDLVGGINIGLNFRNVVESAGAWSCDVRYQGTGTRPAQACTVKVKPYSTIYLGNPAPQLVNLPAAAAWTTVSF